jgi:hypothetical protein
VLVKRVFSSVIGVSLRGDDETCNGLADSIKSHFSIALMLR